MIGLHPAPERELIRPEYVGGPLDGGSGPLEPAKTVLGTIRLAGGNYSLQGFRLYTDGPADRAVYLWEGREA